MADEAIWFYQVMGSEMGPINSAQLKALAKKGSILPETWIRRGQEGNWIEASNLKGLVFAAGEVRSLPPPTVIEPTPPEKPMMPPHIIEVADSRFAKRKGPPPALPVEVSGRGYASAPAYDGSRHGEFRTANSILQIFDFTFLVFVTPIIVKIAWILTIVLLGLMLLASFGWVVATAIMFIDMATKSFMGYLVIVGISFMWFLFTFVVSIVVALSIRLSLEAVVVVFEIANLLKGMSQAARNRAGDLGLTQA